MNIVILDGMESENDIENVLKKVIEKENKSYTYFKLKDMKILPCRNCGICGVKMPGECAFKDDMPKIIKALVKSEMVVMLTPIRFGGFDSQLKKAVDKLSLLGSPFLEVKKGKLSHPGRYNTDGKSMFFDFVIGVSRNHSESQKQSFRNLIIQNAAIMEMSYKTLIVEEADDITKIEHCIIDALKEVAV